MLYNSLYIQNDLMDTEDFERIVMKNINRIKGISPLTDNFQKKLTHPILFITPAQFFWNGIIGQAYYFTEDEGKEYKKYGTLKS